MKQYIAYKTEADQDVLIEVEPTSENEIELVSNSTSPVIERMEKTLDQAMGHLKPAVETALETFRNINETSSVEIEFGVKFSVKAGVVLASADSDASFKVKLKWDKAQQ